MEQEKEFLFSEETEPHKKRTKDILSTHPEVKQLIGKNPYSFLIIVLVVTLQLSIAILLRHQSWWIVIIVAYLIGAFANHNLYVLIHEATHNLIFRNRTANTFAAITADLVNVAPGAISFRTYHLKHHSYQGHYDLDADLASKWEAKLIGHSFISKAIWLILFPLFQALRPPRLREIKFSNKWTYVNWIFVFGMDALVIIYAGPMSFLYLVFSFFFSIGFHPLGARWIQEHYITYPPQETYSYYGKLNIPALNVGYHNEHHDFPSIPWNNLPKVRQAAPEWYNTLHYHTSWFLLFFKFLFDPSISLFSRVVRTNRGGTGI
jgi:sphingolipid 4-desaturase/C4-monooxygenase